ncbi:hypothetical protein, conserved [Babesia bigemina]|uniref:Uncharacterized protein n=1 Tax=Babesia bigemina TaxID=5866 RepID=A0A061BKI4_BABBI|nr:hypothetical protein, conserved [Babesia bigemina]CDR71947.1 hypothetical protein, conserved [Babesia bigemina]|eukprot:XP_012770889.1 hypothetical protein, conserved [Babesia bigemina]
MTSINHPNNLCLVTLPFPSSTSCHCPDHVPPRELDKKFDENKKCEITSNNNPTNILTNLCTGLETFLGFNPETKGYDGSGIVYSDLDRLCDAVMGFLSGVLSNIKDHLGQHKDTLEDAIDTLNTNKHAGKKGFSVAIVKVVEGVGRYNKAVKKSNDQVKNIVTDLQGYTENGGKLRVYLNTLQNLESSSHEDVNKAKQQVEEKLQESQREARNFTDALDTTNTKNLNVDAINDLNDKVKQKLANVRSTVMYENGRLEAVKAHAEGELAETIKKVGEALRALKVSVDCNISEQVTLLVNDLKTRVEKILQLLKTIHSMLIAYVQEVGEWITKAEPAVHAALEKVEQIIREANAGDQSKQPAQIIAVADQLKVQADLLYASGTAAKERVIAEVKTALEAVRKMDGELKEDLYGVKKAVEGQVTKIKEAIGQVYL